ncbi:predicted protein [Nematostella vectensis]|uniref:Cadherin domain-containing protein n=1 Tax=Nematostella vectensis TaxID=45351 RepID=A7S788_NEMVE|nr:predicted protein [Nematostella vectensis]|eukprot:XP_001632517.1 predicted protein [Nematostella vectensis]
MWGLIGILLCSCVAHVAGSISTKSLLVQYGRSASVDPRANFVIHVPRGAICRVTVLRDDPLSQRNGFLVPNQFPCDFKLGEVTYSHLGSKFHTRDFIKFQIRVDTETETKITRVILQVLVLFTQMEIVLKNYPVTVPSIGGISNDISGDVLGFAYDPSNEMCHVVVLRMPRYGKLLNVTMLGPMGARYECSEFITSDIRYVHRNPKSSNRDYVTVMVEISDKEFNTLKREYFQIFIRILGANVNRSPEIAFQASNTLEVKGTAMGAVTLDVLAASDAETPEDDIIFNITQPLGPGEGELITLDDPYQPLTAFHQRDVRELKIAYRPPHTTSSDPRTFQLILRAIDSEGAASGNILFLIMVKPSNTNAPMVTLNAGLSLFEGQSRAITASRHLKVTDNDNFDHVRIQVIGGLRHGSLQILGNRITTFMATDISLDAPVVTYHHDNSETYSDSIIFRASDGNSSVDFVFPVTIAPLDDMAPILVYNTGLMVDEGGATKVDQYMMSAIDVDSDDTKIGYRILPSPSPTDIHSDPPRIPVGVFFLRQRSLPKIFSGWVLQDDGYYEKNVSQFLQSDLMENRLYYRHLGEEIFSDRVKFVLYDNAPRPNISPVQTFNIMISKIDDEPPRLANGASLVITVDEYGQKALTQDILRYTDTDSKDEELLYLTSPSKFVGGTNTSLPAGELVHADTGLPLLQFTQLQVNHGKILLKAPNMEMALLPRYAHIEFSVSDNSGNFIQNQTLRVFYKPLNNKPPEISLVPLTVSNQGVVALTKETIQVQDPDTPVNQLRVVISKLPQYGFLAWDGIQMALGDWFTTDDVRESRLTYQHNSQSREATDEVGLSVEDGAHKTPAILGIFRENSQELIKLPNMSSIENNTVLLVTSPPRLGRIMRHGYEATKFNIRDLDSGMVSYQHTGGETGPGGGVDHFNLSCVDQSVMVMDDKRYHAVTAMALILPVDNQPPEINILRQLIVPEGSSTQVTQRHIAITDPDTRQRDVTCSIDVQPTHGFLENVRPSPGSEVSNAGKRVTSFSIRDLKEGHVNYVQSESAGVEPRMDWVAVSCTDGANTSPRKLISIAILPRNDEAPHLFTRDFVVREGGELVIDVTILNANDADKPMEELIFFVVTPPEHGIIKDTRLETGRNVSVFTLTQLQKSASIVYQHDGSETTRDSLTVRVTDGVHNTTKRIPIRIEQVDDEVPRLVVNVGVRLERPGESEVLTTSNLLATDLDSPDDNLTYIIRSTPRAGVLQRMRRDGTLQKLSLWGTFTQLDLRRRVIVYTQDPSIQTERDSFRFDITDGSNTLLNQVFYVFVRATDRLPPSVISREVKLNQGSRVLITTDYLTASDLQSDNTNLRYKLTRLPTQGHLELLNSPGIEVRTFSQLEVASNKLMYVHSSEEEIAGDSFDFEVSDGASSSVTRKFMITLLDVNNKKPVVTSQALKTREGGDVVITSFELRADDRDTSPENLRFTVTRVPLHGTLLKHGTPCQDFTQDDINKNHVKYLHDGSDTTLDDFLVTITDGAHYDYFLLPNTKTTQRTALRISIHITPVDNRLPQLVYNKGVRDLQVLATGKRGVRITGDTLRAEDPDSNNTELVYKVDTPPLNGFLTRDPATNKLLSKFTQGSLDRDGVYYVLSDSSNATSDMFTFDIVDPAGNTLPSQAFSLVWVWVSFERHFYLIDETSGFLEVVITRAGYLGATSTVRMSVTGITAVLREDFAEPVHSHVQFSPGQTRVLWRMRIIDDRRHEGNETLSLQLVSPRSCVISQFAHALVMIRDPEDGESQEKIRQRSRGGSRGEGIRDPEDG